MRGPGRFRRGGVSFLADGPDAGEDEVLVAQLGRRSDKVAVAVRRLPLGFQELGRAEFAHTVARLDDICELSLLPGRLPMRNFRAP